MKASAVACANIALVKYWGKCDKELILPHNSSISMTTEGLAAHTTIEFNSSFHQDTLTLNGEKIATGGSSYKRYVDRFLCIVRDMAGIKLHAKIVTKNNFPTGAGLASSAAGFAALAAASDASLNLGLTQKELSMLARRGSGSASRSVFSGFVRWNKGRETDGSDSYAEEIAPCSYWNEFRMIVCITSLQAKSTRSRTGMTQTVATSPFYQGWLESIREDLHMVEEGIREKDITKIGQTAEHNALKLHALMISTKPAILYWNPATVDIMHKVMQWRKLGLESYFTIDAGPQVKILCLEKDQEELCAKLREVNGIKTIMVTKPGPGVKMVTEHLF